MKRLLYLLPLALLVCACGDCQKDAVTKGPAYGKGIVKENLNRGLVAVHNGDGNVSVTWRYLESDPIDVAFDVYRKSGDGQNVKLNAEPVAASTFFKDSGVDTTVDNVYSVVVAGKDAPEAGAEYALTVQKASKPYLEIPVQPVEGFEYGKYYPSDGTVADLDGDGDLELVVKMETRGFDNAHAGLNTEGLLLDAYELSGEFMWRVDLGLNIRQGAHYTQFMVHDYDGDGKAEVAVKTAEGTKFGDGTVIGDIDKDGRTDYRDTVRQSRTYGKVLDGPEFLSVIEGTTGKELARADFISRDGEYSFGDNNGNRVDRFLGGAGYFDGKLPSILICRGYYSRTVLEAWDYRGGKLVKRWRFDTIANDDEYIAYEKQGNHNLRVADVDGDGKDEITYGACCIDDDGTGLYTTGYGHGDAMHLSDMLLSRPGLEVWQCHETSPLGQGSELRDALTGELIWGYPSIMDVGRAMAADIDPRFPGFEMWSSGTNGTYTADGRMITQVKPSVNFGIWWDGDLSRELLDGHADRPANPQPMPQLRPGQRPTAAQMQQMQQMARRQPANRYMKISKWNGDGVDYINLPGENETTVNNGSKSNPVLAADVFGDWREELIVRAVDNKSIRIYVTDYETDYRFHTLMSDVPYRLSVLTQNIAYNQPSELGYYLGTDLGKFWPTRRVRNGQATFNSKSANTLNTRVAGTEEIQIKDITVYKNIENKCILDARYDYDTIEWTVNGKVVGKERKLVLNQADYGYDKTLNVHIKVTFKGEVFEDDGTVTFSSQDGKLGEWAAREAEAKGDYAY